MNDKIKFLSIDLFSKCNIKCWYCPNAYTSQKTRVMTINEAETILDKILIEKGSLVDENVEHIYTHAFNEFLLYPHFEEFVELLKKKKLRTPIFTNGVLLKKHLPFIETHMNDTFGTIYLNVPSVIEENWKKITKGTSSQFQDMIEAVTYLDKNHEIFRPRLKLNGVNENSFMENGGHITRMKNFPKFLDSIDDEKRRFQEKFPNITKIYVHDKQLTDWGILQEYEIFSRKMGNIFNIKRSGKNATGCLCMNKVFNGLLVNSYGDLFVCSRDYNQEWPIGNLFTQSLKEIWSSEKRTKVIEHWKKNQCKNCEAATWV